MLDFLSVLLGVGEGFCQVFQVLSAQREMPEGNAKIHSSAKPLTT